MKKIVYFLLLSALFLTLAFPVLAVDIKVPKSTGKVTDLVGLLTPDEADRLRNDLNRFENQTSNEIGVLITDSLQNYSEEDYAFAVFNEWGIGKKDKDNGILIVIAPNEKKFRVEVGYGLGGVLPDIKAKHLAEEYLVPKYRQKKYYEAITGLVEQFEILAAEEYGQSEKNIITETGENREITTLTIVIAAILTCLMIVIVIIFFLKMFKDNPYRHDPIPPRRDIPRRKNDGYPTRSSNRKNEKKTNRENSEGGFGTIVILPDILSSGRTSGWESKKSDDSGWNRNSDDSGFGGGSSDSGWGGGESGGGGCSGDL
jgi:uncharacterized protein